MSHKLAICAKICDLWYIQIMSSEMRDIASLQLWLAKRYRMDSCHDYELASSGVMRLGCYEEIAAEITACLKDN